MSGRSRLDRVASPLVLAVIAALLAVAAVGLAASYS